MKEINVYLKNLTESDKDEFKKKIQESFKIAISKISEDAPVVPSDKELEMSFNSDDNDCLVIYCNNEKIGGAIIKINNSTQINYLEFFFIYKGKHSNGLGFLAWQAIEKAYPETKIWRTVTPYFETRNINFYVNKCGFKVIEYCNKYHKCSIDYYNKEHESQIPEAEDFFLFEKKMI